MARFKRISPLFWWLLLMATLLSCAGRLDSPGLDGPFDWSHGDPIAFLAYLHAQRNDPCPTVVVADVPSDWLKKEHIPKLENMLESQEPCANVHSIYSSFRDCRISTVGHEAAFLIDGFRKGRYPPRMNSGGANETCP